MKVILNIPSHVALNDVKIQFQDKARFGQKNTTTRVWAPKGKRLRVVQQQQYEFTYLFGAVCINTGETEALITPLSNMLFMEEHLKLISKATPKNKHAVVLMEQASWH